MSPAIGSKLGPYKILSALGSGGMGEVYRAHDTKLNRDVAIKVLLPAVANDSDRLARFSREAQVLASLNHPNIAHIYGIEDAAIVMELVEGEDLAQRIARGPIPLDEALPIARQIAEALEAAHDHGIVHRDLKPANIKVRPDGTVKVLDFGLAKAVDPTAGSSATAMNSPTLSIHATQAGIILGTAAYMSPEQARGKSVDKRTDTWALGCVLFEMLTGKRAFPGDDATDTIVAVVSKEPDWSALPTTVPPAIRRLLRRSLEKDPKRRLDSAAAVRLEIDDAAGPLAIDTDSRDDRRRWPRLLPWAIAGTLAIALTVALAYQRPLSPVPATLRFGIDAPAGAVRVAGSDFAISPDGQTVAFLATRDGVGRVYTRRLDQVVAQPVAGTDHAAGAPIWSPDSRSLAFAKEGGLYRTEFDGVVPRRLCDVVGVDGRNLQSGTWGAKGVIVFATSDGLWKVDESGGTPTPLTTRDSATEAAHASPSFLPDGRHVLFLRLPRSETRGAIWVAAIDSQERTYLVDSNGGAVYADGWLFSTTDGSRNLVAQRFDPEKLTLTGPVQSVRDGLGFGTTAGEPGFAVARDGTLIVDHPPSIIHQFVWRDRAGNTLGTIGPEADLREFRLSPDERRVASNAVNRESGKRDLWVFDPTRTAGTRLTFQAVVSRPMWSLDGNRIYFTEFPDFRMRSRVIGGTESQDFDNPGGFMHFEDITRDGRYFVLKSEAPRSTIWLQEVRDPRVRRVVAQHPFGAYQARVSPDGRWVAYASGRQHVYIRPFDRPGGPIQVSGDDSNGPIWRADGRELFFETGAALMAISITERAGAMIAGAPETLFALRTQGFVVNAPSNVEVAANGQKFLVNTIVRDSDNATLEVTLNWTAGLKK